MSGTDDTPAGSGAPHTGAPRPTADPLGPPRHPAVLVAAVALPVALLVGVIAVAASGGRGGGAEGPLPLATVPAPQAGSAECEALSAALPDALGDYNRVELAEPAPAAAAAWRGPTTEPVVLRCGLDRPPDFDQAAAIQVVNGVDWFAVSGAEQGVDATTWFAVDRGVYIALTLPGGAGPTPLQDVSNTVSATLGKQPIDPAPIG